MDFESLSWIDKQVIVDLLYPNPNRINYTVHKMTVPQYNQLSVASRMTKRTFGGAGPVVNFAKIDGKWGKVEFVRPQP